MRLRVAIDISIRVHPLHGIRREEHRRHRILVARVEVIQSRAVVVLPDETLSRVDTVGVVVPHAIKQMHILASSVRN